ncbi:MAG: hypothetical protein GXO79_02755, partial [Chlorobi bacterium]|nr:hypothetical protein [Chlorobiota bacterium]
FNHVILCIPFENQDTVWLECTNQNIPFGYLGDFTDDRDVLIIKNDGGEIAHTTKYTQSQNKQINRATIQLAEDGSGTGNLISSMKGLQYDNLSYLLYKGKEDQKNELYKKLKIEKMHINSFSFNEIRSRIPELDLNVTFEISQYASKLNNRLILPLNLTNNLTYIPKEIKNRRTPVVIKRAYYDIDSIIYEIPENYNVEFVPDTVLIESIFGEYKSITTLRNNKIIYVREMKYNSGKFKPEKYEELRNFYKKIAKADTEKAILKITN